MDFLVLLNGLIQATNFSHLQLERQPGSETKPRTYSCFVGETAFQMRSDCRSKSDLWPAVVSRFSNRSRCSNCVPDCRSTDWRGRSARNCPNSLFRSPSSLSFGLSRRASLTFAPRPTTRPAYSVRCCLCSYLSLCSGCTASSCVALGLGLFLCRFLGIFGDWTGAKGEVIGWGTVCNLIHNYGF